MGLWAQHSTHLNLSFIFKVGWWQQRPRGEGPWCQGQDKAGGLCPLWVLSSEELQDLPSPASTHLAPPQDPFVMVRCPGRKGGGTFPENLQALGGPGPPRREPLFEDTRHSPVSTSQELD